MVTWVNASPNEDSADLAQSFVSANHPPSPPSHRATLPLVTPTRVGGLDPVLRHAERQELLGLDDHVLFVGGAAGVADTGSVHAFKCSE